MFSCVRHIRQEFSEENILAFRAIYNYSRRPDFFKMRDIFLKYIAPDAPLQVR